MAPSAEKWEANRSRSKTDKLWTWLSCRICWRKWNQIKIHHRSHATLTWRHVCRKHWRLFAVAKKATPGNESQRHIQTLIWGQTTVSTQTPSTKTQPVRFSGRQVSLYPSPNAYHDSENDPLTSNENRYVVGKRYVWNNRYTHETDKLTGTNKRSGEWVLSPCNREGIASLTCLH